MVKSILGVNHQGLRDWIIQRVTAIVMAIYSIIMVVFFIMHSDLAFSDWHDLFAHGWMKIATLLFLLCILFHAWVGIWTVFTDYVKCYVLRFALHTLVFFALVAFFFEGLMILWGV